MKNTLVLLGILLAIVVGCEDEPTLVSDCAAPTFLEEDGAIISDPFQVSDARLNGTCLEIDVAAGGRDGESWGGQLFVFPSVAESLPPQVTVEFALDDKELCEAAIQKTFSFDLSGLFRIDDRVIVRLNGWDGLLLLESQPIDLEELQATWNLINVNGGLTGIDMRFDPGEVTWEFEQNEVTIQNSVNDETSVGLKSGTFVYIIEESDEFAGRYELSIDSTNLGPITHLNTDSLIVDLRLVDGLQYVLIK